MVEYQRYVEKNYDDEFKRNDLQKVFDGQSVRSVTEELRVYESLIHKRKRAAKTFSDGKQTGSELLEVFTYIEVYYNRIRRYSSLGDVNPIDFEKS